MSFPIIKYKDMELMVGARYVFCTDIAVMRIVLTILPPLCDDRLQYRCCGDIKSSSPLEYIYDNYYTRGNIERIDRLMIDEELFDL